MTDAAHGELRRVRQCERRRVSRSAWYDRPRPVDPQDLERMRRIEEPYLKTPF